MVIAPQTNIRLLKTPIELDNRNQLTFASKQSQYNYFNGLPKVTLDNATYQRKDNVLRFPTNQNLTFEDLLQYNYCMYQNDSYDDKWFYAFITNISYENNGMSLITLETDVFQTWQFDIIYKASFIEREHVNDDTVGLHTIPEGLETGDFICNSHIIDNEFDDILNDFTYVMSTSINLTDLDEATGKFNMASGRKYNGIYSGTNYFTFSTQEVINGILEEIAMSGQIDTINGLFMAPKILVSIDPNDTLGITVSESNAPITYYNSISKQTTLNGYTPKNKKLLIGDYNYLLVSNNNGNSVVMKYEDFSQANCTFKINMVLTPGCSIRMIPTNYKTISEADEYGINMGKLPICSYVCDMYTNWLTQNSINVGGELKTSADINTQKINANAEMGVLSSVLNGSLFSLGGLASTYQNIGNSILDIEQNMITKRQQELIPPQSRGNLNAGDVITASNKNNFQFYKMSIRQEYARIIDNFFSMFGYKVNDVKIPNITGRTNWNYVKTSGCNFTGNIPQNDMQNIKSLFNAGITLWHNSSTFLDYSQSNNIV